MSVMTETQSDELQYLDTIPMSLGRCGRCRAKAVIRFVSSDFIRDRCGHHFNDFITNVPAEYTVMIDERTKDNAFILDRDDEEVLT